MTFYRVGGSQERFYERTQGYSPERSERQSILVREPTKDFSRDLTPSAQLTHTSSKLEGEESTHGQQLLSPDPTQDKMKSQSIKRGSTMSGQEIESLKRESVLSKNESISNNTASDFLLKEPKASRIQSSKNTLSSKKEGSPREEKIEKEEHIKIENNIHDEVSFRNESDKSEERAESDPYQNESEQELEEENEDSQHDPLENSNDQLNSSQEQLNFTTAEKRRDNSFIYRRPMMDQGSIDRSSKTSFLNPLKVNAEVQTAADSIISAINGFDITKMEPYTLEFLKVLEAELTNIRSSIKETKEGIVNYSTHKALELNLHLNYHYYNDKNTDFHKDYYEKTIMKEVAPQTFDNVLSELQAEANEKRNRPKSSGIHSKVKLSPMLLLRMIARRKTLGNKIKKINELSQEMKGNPDPMISVKSHSFDQRRSPSRSPDNSLIHQHQKGNNTIREAHESHEQDERLNTKSYQPSHLGYLPSKKNKSEDTSD